MTVQLRALLLSVLVACARPPLAPRAPAPSPAPEPAPSPAPAPRRAVRNHVLSTGQSLAVGVAGVPVTSTEQPFENVMFATGVMAGGEELTSLVPLVEGDFIPGSKARVETMSSGFANLVSGLARAAGGRHDLLVSVHGSGAKTYAQLKLGTRPFTTGLAQVTAAKALADAANEDLVVRAVTTVHGESDHAEKSTRYLEDLLQWQADYEREVGAITHQKEPVPLFQTQMSSWTKMMGGTETSTIPAAQLAAHVSSHGKVVLVGPKYHLPYSKDGVHLTGPGYRRMGEDYGKAYHRLVVEKQPWEPLRPLTATREGRVVTLKLLVPVPPLVLDTTLVTDPGNFGFEIADASPSTPRIERVEIAGPDTVTVTLSAAPTGQDLRLRYAWTGTRGARSGPTSGARGNLRDSDPTRGRSGDPLFDWCVHFDIPVE